MHSHSPSSLARSSTVCSRSRSGELNLRLQRDRLGELEEYKAPRKTDRAKWNADTDNAIAKTQALIDSLGENDPILRAMLRDAEAARAEKLRILRDVETKLATAKLELSQASDAVVAANRLISKTVRALLNEEVASAYLRMASSANAMNVENAENS